MNSILELCRLYADLLRRRREANTDCRSTAVRAAAYLHKSGYRGLVFRRQGMLTFDGKCLDHEWLELPESKIVVLDFCAAFRLPKELPVPLILEGADAEEYDIQGLHYAPDPYRRYKGVWNPQLQAFDWHLAPATDLISQ
jgi:hypothetical protein